MESVVHVLVFAFAAIIVLGAVVFLVVDMFGRVDFLNTNEAWLPRFLERRKALNICLLVAVFLLIGNGYELLIKEIPEIPEPPVLKIAPPKAPSLTINEVAPPIKAQCWVRNYAVPALASPAPWGMATIFCNTTIKPLYSVELIYDQTVEVGPFAFPVGSEPTKVMESNQGTKVLGMFDVHTIIPNEPFSIMARGSSDKFPLVKTVTIRAKGLALEFHP
jgi:hypothetical protein